METSSGPETRTGIVRLRPYQTEAIQCVNSLAKSGARRILVVAPTGAGKCVTPDTWVWSGGLKRFGEIWGANCIQGPHGIAKVNGWYDDGVRDGYKVTLECGLEIDGTPRHRVWVRTEQGFEGWRRLSDLTCDDYVAVARGQADWGQREMAPDEAYALGMVLGAGQLHDQGMSILANDVHQLKYIGGVTRRWSLMAEAASSLPEITSGPDECAAVVCRGNFRRLFGKLYKCDVVRSIPQSIRAGTRSVAATFLRGYFDGNAVLGRGLIADADPLVSSQLQQLLLGLGVYARTHAASGSPHRLEVVDVAAFVERVGLTPSVFSSEFIAHAATAGANHASVDRVPGIGALLREAAARFLSSVGDEERWLDAAASSRDRSMSYDEIKAFVELVPACPERMELERIVAEHRIWSRVVAVVPVRSHRIDCEVDEQHAFVGNGIVNHNTVIACSMIRQHVAADRRVLFMAHRRELINQAYSRLVDHGIPEREVGVLMASDSRRRPGAHVQVASVDTLRNRPKPRADVVILDEAHRSLAATNVQIAASYPEALHLGLTATPYRADGKGLGDAYDELVLVASPRQLIDDGFLVEPRIFTMPPDQMPDLSRVKLQNGDYAAGELGRMMDKQALVGNIVEHWLEHAGGVRTVAFASSVAHSKHIAERFVAAGVAAEHLDGETPTAERDAILGRLERGDTRVVSNMGVLCEGWDQPSVKCAILARPTKSTGLYLQQAGRILRPWNDHPAVILDHAGCALEHGLPQDTRQFALHIEKKRRNGKGGEAPAKQCESCNMVVPLSVRTCPECGAEFPRIEILGEADGKLIEITPEQRQSLEWQRLLNVAAEKGYKSGWAYYRYRDQFGEEPPDGIHRGSPAPRLSDVERVLREAARRGSFSWDQLRSPAT